MSGLNSTLARSLGPSVFGIASREMDSLFDRLFYPNEHGMAQTWAPPISVWEEDNHYHLEMDLPGLKQDDLELTFEEKRLKISARRYRQDDDGRKYLHDERGWGEISRLVSVPDSVDPESIEASYDDGVLHVRLTKRPEVLPRKIEIASK